jgi:hypothetical protein
MVFRDLGGGGGFTSHAEKRYFHVSRLSIATEVCRYERHG